MPRWPHKKEPVIEPRIKTFDEFISQYRITPTERIALVWHLAEFRARKTVEALLFPTKEAQS